MGGQLVNLAITHKSRIHKDEWLSSQLNLLHSLQYALLIISMVSEVKKLTLNFINKIWGISPARGLKFISWGWTAHIKNVKPVKNDNISIFLSLSLYSCLSLLLSASVILYPCLIISIIFTSPMIVYNHKIQLTTALAVIF